MYFFLLNNYSNYVALDEALALVDLLKKNLQQKSEKGNRQQPLETIILLKMFYFSSSILLSALAFKLLPVRTNAYHMCVLFYSSCLWHWWIQNPCSVNGALFDKSQRLETISVITKSSILYVAGVLDLPLKIINKLRQKQYCLSPVSGFH